MAAFVKFIFWLVKCSRAANLRQTSGIKTRDEAKATIMGFPPAFSPSSYLPRCSPCSWDDGPQSERSCHACNRLLHSLFLTEFLVSLRSCETEAAGENLKNKPQRHLRSYITQRSYILKGATSLLKSGIQGWSHHFLSHSAVLEGMIKRRQKKKSGNKLLFFFLFFHRLDPF